MDARHFESNFLSGSRVRIIFWERSETVEVPVLGVPLHSCDLYKKKLPVIIRLLARDFYRGSRVIVHHQIFSDSYWFKFITRRDSVSRHYLNNRVFMSRNCRLIVAPRKFDVLKTNICPRSEASRANMLVLRTSNSKGQLSHR